MTKAEKTPFSRSSFFAIFQSLIPCLVIWIVYGKDFNILHFTLSAEWQTIISFLLIIWTCLTTFIIYKLGYTNFDQFGFSVPITFVMIALFISSFFGLSFWIRLIICLVAIAVSSLLVNMVIYIGKWYFDRYKSNKNIRYR